MVERINILLKSLVRSKKCINGNEFSICSMKATSLIDKIGVENVDKVVKLKVAGVVNDVDLMFISKMENLEDLDMSGCIFGDNISVSRKTVKSASEFLRGKTSLKRLVMPGFLSYIPMNALEGCVNLKSAVLSEKIERISSFAFSGTGIEEIVIPKSVKVIDIDAFSNCANLKRVIVEDSNEYISWKGTQFVNCPAFEELYIGRNSHYDFAPIVEENIRVLYLGKGVSSYNVCAKGIESIVLLMETPPSVNATLHNGCSIFVGKKGFKFFWTHPQWGKLTVKVMDSGLEAKCKDIMDSLHR